MTPVPQKATYWSYMLEWAGYLNTWFINNNHPANDGGLAQTYYDGMNCAIRLYDQLGVFNPTVNNFIVEGFNAYTTYYVIPNSGSVQGFRNFTDGELQGVLRGFIFASQCLNALNLQLVNGAYVASGDVSDSLLSRECAYALETHINAGRAGISLSGAQIARREQLKTWALGHIDQWCVSFTAPYFRPFMGAITAKALIDYYTYISADAAIVSQLKIMADYTFSACWKATAGAWGAGQSFLYTDRTGFDPQDGFTQPDLNMLIVPTWGWLYFKGQGGGYRSNGDLIFQGGLPVYSGGFYVSGTYLGTQNATNPAGKQYDQQLYWGPRYIEWAEAAVSGTTYTSAIAGDWNVSGHWSPAGIPGPGDRVIISASAAISVSNSEVIGDSPAAGTPVITVNSGATLTIATGQSITCRGDVLIQGTGSIVNAAGSGFTFDASLATPGTKYQASIGSTHNSTPSWLMNGSSGSHVTIGSNTAGGNGWFNDGSGPWLQAGLITATYTDFTNIGDDTNPSIQTSPTSGTTFSLTHCTFNRCGRIDGTYNVGATCTYILDHCVFTNGLDSDGIDVRINGNTSKSGGNRKLYDNIFNGSLHFYPARNFDIQRNGFFGVFDTTDGDWTTFKNNFVRYSTTFGGPFNAAGDTDTNYLYFDDPSSYNPHFIQPLSYSRDQVHTGNIFDMNCASVSPPMEGDAFTFATPSGACVATITNNIMLMGPNNKTVATLIDMLGNANTDAIVEHNTCFTGTQGASIGETYVGHTGQLHSFKSNLMWNVNALEGYKLYVAAGQTAISNLVTSANADYNGGWNLAVGNNLKGYNNLLFSSGSPGAHDVNGAPNFTDYTRNLRSWDASKGGPGTDASAYARIQADTTMILDVITWVSGGFHPTNIIYQGTAHDGGTIGAMSYQGPTVTVHDLSLLGVGY